MALNQRQQLKQLQKLSPQQLLAIRLLELPALEIEESIKQELNDNPALEEGKDYSDEQDMDMENAEEATDATANEDISLGDYLYEDDIPDYKLAEMSSKEERKEITPYNNE